MKRLGAEIMDLKDDIKEHRWSSADNLDEGSSVILSPSFAVLTTKHECWTCAGVASISALWGPCFVERFDDSEELSIPDPAVLRYVESLNLPAKQHITAAAPWM